MPSKNMEVMRRARNKWYRNNKRKQINRQIERRKILILALHEYKKTLHCSDCGMSFNNKPECCDFHHKEPNDKVGEIRMLACYSDKSMKAELEKCVPLCANCHRTRHKDKHIP